MKDGIKKWMQLPRDVVIGHGVIYDIKDVCKDLKLGANPLIVTGKNTKAVAGDVVCDSLNDGGYNASVAISQEASLVEVELIKKKAIELSSSFLLGVGSGKSIDVAKLAATEVDVPFLSVPTAASHDGIVSSRASIRDGGHSTSIEANAPMAVIADTEVIANAPYRLLAAGCADIVSNYTAVKDWELAHRLRNEPFSEYASALSLMSAKILLDSADSIKTVQYYPPRKK